MNTIKENFQSMLTAFKPGSISHVLFTTFNFSSRFFEQNVLPLVVDAELGKGVDLDPLQLNEALQDIHVSLFCDKATNPGPKGNYRYGVLPVHVEKGFFHPKIILVAGEFEKEPGKIGIQLLVGSCNMSLSGWGMNREVAAICEVDVEQAQTLLPLIDWLAGQVETTYQGIEGREEGSFRTALPEWRSLLEGITKSIHGNPKLYIRLPEKNNAAHFLRRIVENQQFQEATLVSPFWSGEDGVTALLNCVGVTQAAFVPSVNANGWSLPSSLQFAIQSNPEKYTVKNFHLLDRYTHAKSFCLSQGIENRLIIGSSNFTQAALGKEDQGNVEAVLVFQDIDQSSWESQLKIYEDIKWTDDEGVNEDAPKQLPFDLIALYDWDTQRFLLTLQCNEKVFDSLIQPVTIHGKSVAFKKVCKGLYESKLYAICIKPCHAIRVSYKEGEQVIDASILVLQINAKDDQLGYRPPPSLNRLVDQLRRLNPSKQSHSFDLRALSLTNDTIGDDDEEKVVDYDFFSIFQATYKLKESYSQCPLSERNPFDERSPYSLTLLFRALQLDYEGINNVKVSTREIKLPYFIRYYIFLQELLDVCTQLEALPKANDSDDLIGKVSSALDEHTPLFIEKLQESKTLKHLLMKGSEPRQVASAVFEWFKEEWSITT